MKNKLFFIIGTVLVFIAGLGAGIIIYPYALSPQVEEIPVLYGGDEIIDTQFVIDLVRERIVLHAIIDQQQEMISVYDKMIDGYDKALNILINIAARD